MTTAVERATARRHHAACTTAIELAKTSANNLWDALAEVHRLEAWRVRGFSSFTDWAQNELDVSARQSYRYMAKAREAVAIAAATGVTVAEAAETVPLTPKRTTPKPEVVAGVPRVVSMATKLTAEISHLHVGVPLSPEAQEALGALLRALQAAL